MKTPKYGTRITKMSHAALPKPERSRRLNTSPKTVIRSQNQITHAKNTSMVHITSRNGYELAITLVSFAESIAIGPKTCSSQRAYASRSPLIVADLQVDVHHPIRMIATAVGVAGF